MLKPHVLLVLMLRVNADLGMFVCFPRFVSGHRLTADLHHDDDDDDDDSTPPHTHATDLTGNCVGSAFPSESCPLPPPPQHTRGIKHKKTYNTKIHLDKHKYINTSWK